MTYAAPSLPTPPSSLEGTLIGGKFRLERVLGEGGMGVVYAAVHLDLRRHVAIKLIRDELATNPEVVERMINEARIAASLRSEHVARVLDVGTLETGAPFIVMEYLEGADLATMLADGGPLAPTMAVDYVIQACEAVAEAHAAGIVHRDLKPDNIFIASGADGEPMAKVLDFGVSKVLLAEREAGALTNPSSLIGSPSYMAPESMQNSDQAGPPADVWSLGAVLYELLSGVRPFDGKNLPETCAKVLATEPAPLRSLAPTVPLELEGVVQRCLEKDPTKRFTVLELAAALAPLGSIESSAVVKRIERVASGIRIKPRSLTPSSRAAGVASPAPTMSPTAREIGPAVSIARSGERPWLKAVVVMGAVLSVVLIGLVFTVARRGREEIPDARAAAERFDVVATPVAEPVAPPPVEAKDAPGQATGDARKAADSTPPPPAAEPTRSAPTKAETAKAETAKTETAKADTSRKDSRPTRSGPLQTRPTKVAKVDGANVDGASVDGADVDGADAVYPSTDDAPVAEPAKPGPAPSAPGSAEPAPPATDNPPAAAPSALPGATTTPDAPPPAE